MFQNANFKDRNLAYEPVGMLVKGLWFVGLSVGLSHLEHAYKKLLMFQLCVSLMAVHSFMQRPIHPSFGWVEIWMDGRALCRIKLLPVTCFGGHVDVNC